MKRETSTTAYRREDLMRILPMYAAACVVLLCGIGAYLSTYDGFGGGAVAAVLAGVAVSSFARLRHLRQDAMFGFLAAMVLVLISWVTVTGGATADALGVLGDRNNFPGVLLAWFVILYSFAMVTDEVIIFAIVPSIALLGTVASDNLNADIVVYFLGLLVAAVFLLVYENMLSRGAAEARIQRPGASGAPAGVRTSLLMTALVVAMAMGVGFAGSRPLAMVGDAIRGRTPEMPVPGASQFASDMTARYLNEMDLSGAPPHLSDRVVMRVHTPRPLYWRGQVFTSYTGYSWTGSNRPHYSEIAPGLIAYSRSDGEEGADQRARVPIIQHYELKDPPSGGILMKAPEEQRTYMPGRVQYPRYDGQFTGRGPARPSPGYGGRRAREYTVLSSVSVATPDQLRAAGTKYPVALRFANTQLGGDPNPTRKAIAERVTAGATTEYDKVKALETWLQHNFNYTLNPPRTPSSVDAVTYFLTRTKQGYCEIFASSMAVLCRELGIPARLATGFAPGDWESHGGGSAADYADGLELSPEVVKAAEKAGSYGVATVRERDLHAWTEVYFPGYGWIAFDPTSSREAEPAWGTSAGDIVRNLLRRVAEQATGPGLIVLAIGALSVFLLKTYGLDTLRDSAWWKSLIVRYRRSAPPRARWDAMYARACRRLRRLAGARAPEETPFEYAARVRAAAPPAVASAFDALTAHYVHHAFRREDPTEDDAAAFTAMEDALKRALKQRASTSDALAAGPATP